MNLIITMAGAGERFKRAGYTVPKYRIEARGRLLFDWSMDSLRDYFPHSGKTVFLVRKEENARDFLLARCQTLDIAHPEIVELEKPTDGQATTALLGVARCAPEEPVFIYNIDTYVEPYALRFSDLCGDGCIPCFHAPGAHWSFVRADADGRALEVREKVRISDNCSIGAYYFRSGALFSNTYDALYGLGNAGLREKYVAPMYDRMIADGYDVRMTLVDASCVHVLGTPEELDCFLEA